MSLTLNAKAYAFDTSISRDSVQYNGPASTLSVRDQLVAKRSVSPATDVYSGTGRSSVKLTRTCTDGTDDVGEGGIEISIFVPIDTQTSEQQALLDDCGAWLDGAEATALFLNHDINQ